MPKKILVIDDSALMRRVISDIINQSNEYEVAAIARDGVEGFDLIVSNPTLYAAVILDINMPKMNGLELLEMLQKNRINQTVIVVSTVAKEGAKETIRALELGAFDFVTKPEDYLETKSEKFKVKIHEMLDIATKDKSVVDRLQRKPIRRTTTKVDDVVTEVKRRLSGIPLREQRTSRFDRVEISNRLGNAKSNLTQVGQVHPGRTKLIALACSTGGPKSLQQVIPLLPKNLDAAVVLVQHMPRGFTASLAQRLDEISEIHVKEAEDGDVITKGNVYIAPGGMHMRVVCDGSKHSIKLSQEAAIDGLRPCANIMYESIVDCRYDEITCVVLTGMGADGTKGIKSLADHKKNIHVIAQDEDSCVVYGMPKAIAQTGLVDEVVTLQQIAETITKNVGVS